MNNKTSALLMGLLGLTGCAQEPVHVRPPTPIEVSINETADSINKSLIHLVAIEQAQRKAADETVMPPSSQPLISGSRAA